MLSAVKKMKLLMVAHKYGLHIKETKPGLIKVYIAKWELFEEKLTIIINEVEQDPDVKQCKVNHDEKTVEILYEESAIQNNRTVERWLSIFDNYF